MVSRRPGMIAIDGVKAIAGVLDSRGKDVDPVRRIVQTELFALAAARTVSAKQSEATGFVKDAGRHHGTPGEDAMFDTVGLSGPPAFPDNNDVPKSPCQGLRHGPMGFPAIGIQSWGR